MEEPFNIEAWKLLVFGVNAETFSYLWTFIGEELNKQLEELGLTPVSVVIIKNKEKEDREIKVKFSIWALTKEINFSKIAEFYGGGGHAQASSFILSLKDYQNIWISDSINLLKLWKWLL